MPAGWVAAAGAVIGAGASIYGASQTADAAESAAKREGEASQAALARSEGAFAESEAALQPYALQEQVASSQYMAQLGLAPPAAAAGGGATAGSGAAAGGGEWGFGADPSSAGLDLEGIPRTGVATEDQVRQAFIQQGGREPTSYELDYYMGKRRSGAPRPRLNELWNDILSKDPWQMNSAWYDESGPKPFEGEVTSIADRNMATTGQGMQEGPGDFIDPDTGQPTGGGPGAPQAQTISDIMGRAGAEQLDPAIGERYQADLMEDARTDPELAAYLGLTEESMQVGAGYQDTPAYMAAREAGVEAVDQGAAGAGGLYSGARGKALRDVGQEVEQGYYFDAMNRREGMMGARRGERQAGIARRGGAYEADQSRGQSYYNNYMQMLSSLSDPRTTTNIEQMRQGAAQGESANIMGTARGIGDLEIGAAGATQAAYADVAGGAMRMGEAWIGQDN